MNAVKREVDVAEQLPEPLTAKVSGQVKVTVCGVKGEDAIEMLDAADVAGL